MVNGFTVLQIYFLFWSFHIVTTDSSFTYWQHMMKLFFIQWESHELHVSVVWCWSFLVLLSKYNLTTAIHTHIVAASTVIIYTQLIVYYVAKTNSPAINQQLSKTKAEHYNIYESRTVVLHCKLYKCTYSKKKKKLNQLQLHFSMRHYYYPSGVFR